MNKAEFTNLIKNPNQLGSEHIETLKKIVADYPYFSTAHILLAKALLNTNHYEYEKQLKVTALSVGDRSILHQFLSDYDLESESFELNVPIELKVEKVSKPDFEIGVEEQKALENEGKEPNTLTIDSENMSPQNTNVFEENIVTENTLIDDEKIVESTEETNIPETAFLPQNHDNLENSETELLPFLGKNEEIIEKIEEPKTEAEELVNTIPTAIETESDKTVIHSNENNLNYQLTETEGTLVRFSINENFLPDFDEASLFTDELNIETITKSVLPVVNTPAENNLEAVNNPILEEKIAAKNTQPTTEIPDENELTQEEIINTLPAEEIVLTQNQETKTLASDNIVSLEHLLDSENNNATELETLEPVTPIDDNSVVNEIPANIAEPILVDTTNIDETANITENEAFTKPEADIINDSQLIDNESVANNDITEPTGVESHNFIEWLAAKNKSEIHLAEFEVKPSSSKSNFEIENDDFVEKINQILKTKADFDLSRNIAYEINSAHDGMVPFERKSAVIEIPATDEEPIENELENSVDEEIKTTNSTDDEVFDEIEAFKTHTPIIDVVEENIVNAEPQVEEEDAIENHFIEEIYTGQVESILPDFDALQNADSIAEEENTQQEITAVSADNTIEETTIEVEETPAIDDEKEEIEEVQEFNPAPINEIDFDAFFEKVYEPIVIEKQEVKVEVEVEAPKVVAKNTAPDNSKLDVESILDKFMRENPSITRPKSEFFNPANVAKQSVEEKDEIVSETLAGIYLKQGLIKKAISTYEKLSLIYPHKITYFAALINQLKTEHNIN